MTEWFIHPLLFIKVTNIVRYFLCMTVLGFHIPRKDHFPARITGAAAVCILTALALPIVSDSLLYVTSIFLAECLVCLFAVRSCWKTDWQTALFVAAASFSCEHIASMMDSLTAMVNPELFSFMSTNTVGIGVLLNYTVWLAVTLGLVYHLMFRRLNLSDGHNLSINAMVLLLVVSLLVNLYMNLVYSQSAPEQTEFQSVFEYAVNIVCSFFLLVIQNGILRESQMEKRLEMTSMLWEQAREQYRISKENVDLINMKSHDLKHRLLAVKDLTSEQEYNEIMEAIDSYGSQIVTGNEVLDVIFEEKNLLCRRQGIQFACIIDGKALSFIDTTDLYVLFGNLIDNCIEAVGKIPEGEVKNIQVTVRREKGFVLISTENSYVGRLEWSGGRLRTSKADTLNHGYGMLSIENIVHKYEGRYSLNTENQIFSMNILLPVR